MACIDPIKLTLETRRLVCDGSKRKYDFIRVVKSVYRAVPTAYASGCNLRCFFCWAPKSRDDPSAPGIWLTPHQLLERFRRLCRGRGFLRLSGGEPLICWEHVTEFLELAEDCSWVDTVLLETNGIVLGAFKDVTHKLSRFSKLVVRVSVKILDKRSYEAITGACGRYVDFVLEGIRQLWKLGVNFYVAVLADPRVVSAEAYAKSVAMLYEVSPEVAENVEVEVIVPYRNAVERLRRLGVKLDFSDKWRPAFRWKPT